MSKPWFHARSAIPNAAVDLPLPGAGVHRQQRRVAAGPGGQAVVGDGERTALRHLQSSSTRRAPAATGRSASGRRPATAPAAPTAHRAGRPAARPNPVARRMFRSRRRPRPHPRRPAGPRRPAPGPSGSGPPVARPSVSTTTRLRRARSRAFSRTTTSRAASSPCASGVLPPVSKRASRRAGDVHRRRRRQQQPWRPAAERDHRDLVATLISVPQQRQRRATDRRHPVARRHRTRRVDHEDHQVAFAALPDRAAHVVGFRPRTARPPLPTRGGQQGARRHARRGPVRARLSTTPTGSGAVARPRPPARCALPHTGHHQRPGAEDAAAGAALGRGVGAVSELPCGGRSIRRPSSDAPPPPGGSGSGSGSGRPACSRACAIASSSCCGSSPGSSNGSRRRRCGSASSAATRMSSSATVVAPRQAACATAVRATTRSARIPSTSNAAHSAAMRRNSLSGNTTSPMTAAGGGDPAAPARRPRSA